MTKGPQPRRQYGEPEKHDIVLYQVSADSIVRSLGVVRAIGPKIARLRDCPGTSGTHNKQIKVDLIDGIFLSPGEARSALAELAERQRATDGNASIPPIIDRWEGTCNQRKYNDD